MKLSENKVLGYAYIFLMLICFGLHASFFVIPALLPAITLILHSKKQGESEKANASTLIGKKIILLAGFLFLAYVVFLASPNKFAVFYFIYVPIVQAGAIILTQLLMSQRFKNDQKSAESDRGFT